jgi:excisionase family DNA binding protein
MDTTFYTPDEVAELFKVTPQAVYKWIRTGRLKAAKLGGRAIRISKEHLNAFIYESEQAAVPESTVVPESAVVSRS